MCNHHKPRCWIKHHYFYGQTYSWVCISTCFQVNTTFFFNSNPSDKSALRFTDRWNKCSQLLYYAIRELLCQNAACFFVGVCMRCVVYWTVLDAKTWVCHKIQVQGFVSTVSVRERVKNLHGNVKLIHIIWDCKLNHNARGETP